MKSMMIVLTALAVLALWIGLCQAGTSSEEWSVGPYVANAPWKVVTEGTTITLGSSADLSPIPSEVRYWPEDKERLWNYGVLIKRNTYMWAGEAEWIPAFMFECSILDREASVASASGGAGLLGTYALTDHIFVSAGGFLFVGYQWGSIGDVGDASGDIYLDAPDGNRYEAGSWIHISRWVAGTDFLAGLELAFSDDISLRGDGGYRFAWPTRDWEYCVKDEAGDSSSELPASGFSEEPPEIDFSGPLMRVGLVYNF